MKSLFKILNYHTAPTDQYCIKRKLNTKALLCLLNRTAPITESGIDIHTTIIDVTAQAVGRQLPTAAARVRFHVRSRGICRVQNRTGTGDLRIFRFTPPVLIPPTALDSLITVSSNAMWYQYWQSRYIANLKTGNALSTNISPSLRYKL
jgi:hypothetical protein